MKLTKEVIDSVLARAEKEIAAREYQLPKHLFEKFDGKSDVAKANMNYINGEGGYYYQLLPLLVRYLQPSKILELGSSHGVSALMMYSELPEGSDLITVDLEHDIRFLPEQILKDQRFRFVLGDDLDLNIFHEHIPFGVDLLYIDTLHFAQQVRDEFAIYQYLLADTALVVMDDIHYKDTGELFFESRLPKWDVTELYHHNGFGLMLFERPASFPVTQEESLFQAALASARIGHRKFHNLERELNTRPHRRYYAMARSWAAQHKKSAALVRKLVKPAKKLITPQDKVY